MDKDFVKAYETNELIVYWRPGICQHAGECVKGSPKVFEVGRRPWIMPENDTTEHLMKVIDRCPSKALTYKRK